jgi:hypothetical protein
MGRFRRPCNHGPLGAHRNASTERLLVIAGTELDARADGKGDAHVLALGVTSTPPMPETETPSLDEAVAWVRSGGASRI